MLKILKVTGNSLSPFFLPGDFILVWRAPRRFPKLVQGDFVVFDHVEYGVMVKRVITNDPHRKVLQVEGTHPDSLSTQKIGAVSYRDLIGKVLHRSRP